LPVARICGRQRLLRRAGADFVVAGEAEIGVALTEAVISLSENTKDDAVKRRAQTRRHLL